MKKRRICIIYTGGTIGMIPSERGYIPSSGAFRQPAARDPGSLLGRDAGVGRGRI